VTGLAAAALCVSGCGGQARRLACAAEIAAVIDDDQDVISPVTVRQHVQILQRKLSESERDSKRSPNRTWSWVSPSSTVAASHENK
jgi:hypothetical protein